MATGFSAPPAERSTRSARPLNQIVVGHFSTLKHELGLDDDAEILNSPQQLIREMAFWIDGYYNRERRHSTISFLSPIDYEQQFINTRRLSHVEP